MSKVVLSSTDGDIRAALRSRLAQRHASDQGAFVVEELPIARGGSRVDLAVINGRLEGYEIKSSKDTLDRLPRQAELYSASLERMTLVAASKHLAEAMDIIPKWWAVFSAERGARGAVRFRRVRSGKLNPSRCPSACVELLERNELVSLLSAHGLDKGFRTATWWDLAERVTSRLPPKAIFDGVRRQLKIRTVLEAQYSETAFGSTAAGGGIAAALTPFMDAVPAELCAD